MSNSLTSGNTGPTRSPWIWLTPIGPPLWEAYWLPFLIVGLIFALVLAAAAQPPPRRSTVELVEPAVEEAEKRAVYWTVGIFFWFLIVALIIAIVWRYL